MLFKRKKEAVRSYFNSERPWLLLMNSFKCVHLVIDDLIRGIREGGGNETKSTESGKSDPPLENTKGILINPGKFPGEIITRAQIDSFPRSVKKIIGMGKGGVLK